MGNRPLLARLWHGGGFWGGSRAQFGLVEVGVSGSD